MVFVLQVPFKHDSLLVDKKELKLTKAEKREAKRGLYLSFVTMVKRIISCSILSLSVSDLAVSISQSFTRSKIV